MEQSHPHNNDVHRDPVANRPSCNQIPDWRLSPVPLFVALTLLLSAESLVHAQSLPPQLPECGELYFCVYGQSELYVNDTRLIVQAQEICLSLCFSSYWILSGNTMLLSLTSGMSNTLLTRGSRSDTPTIVTLVGDDDGRNVVVTIYSVDGARLSLVPLRSVLIPFPSIQDTLDQLVAEGYQYPVGTLPRR
jgi:hypothetical protein